MPAHATSPTRSHRPTTTRRALTHRVLTHRAFMSRAFTIIELLVVVLIIAVLVAIGLAVGNRVVEGGRATQTRDLIKTLETALNTYEQTTDALPPAFIIDPRYPKGTTVASPVFHPLADAVGVGGAGLGTSGQSAGPITINSLGLFLHEARGVAGVSSLFDGLSAKNFTDFAYTADPATDPGQTEPALPTVLDAWGNPVRFVHPRFHGRRTSPEDLSDPALLGPAPDSGSYFPDEIRRDPEQGDADGGLTVGGRPYFYSAGPDANAGAAEDNVYTKPPRFQDEN